MSDVVTTPRWFGARERPLLGWLTTPAEGAPRAGALILPAVGYQYWSAHRALRVLAERLAAQGHLALRLDYDGTGDSAGGDWDGGRVAAWRESARHGASELRALGCRELTVIGVRLGATIALLDGAELGADAVVAWAPVHSGRRYARELRLLSTPVPAPAPDGAIASAGMVFTAETLASLGGLTATAGPVAPAPRALIVGSGDDAAAESLADHLRGLGCDAESARVEGGEQALELPTEYATVPEDIVDAICAWCGPAEQGAEDAVDTARATTSVPWGGRTLEETVVTLGPHRLVGVSTEPPEPDPDAATLVFLNSGSEPHVGPGRAWVQYARDLALLGHRALRVDFRGWGESPDDGFAPGRPYDAHCEDDAVEVVRALHAAGHRRVVLAGLCASAWVALRVALRESVDGIVAINPQLYWRPGDPVEATMAETRARRQPERERDERLARWGVWTALDRLGHRPWAARWLDGLAGSRTPVLMLFAEGDDGIEYLRTRTERRLGEATRTGAITVAEVPDIDHSMHRTWLRDGVVAALHEYVEALPRAAAPAA